MKGLKLGFFDIKRMFQHKHGRIALIFLLIIPVIYASLFLGGYWDPYGHIEDLPVAVVNQDDGASMDGEEMHAGDDFIKELKKSKALDFDFVSDQKAEDGLDDGKYYMKVTIPKDFSEKVTTLMDDKPEQAELTYEVNPGKNFVAAQISSSAMEEMKTKLASSITKSYADSVFTSFHEVATGLQDAGDGAGDLNKGITDEQSGMKDLQNGIGDVKTGASDLTDGADKLAGAEGKLSDGIGSLHTGASDLASGLDQLDEGASSLQTNTDKIADGLADWKAQSDKLSDSQDSFTSGSEDLSKLVASYMKEHPELKDDKTFQQIVAASDQLTDSSAKLADGQQQLGEGADKLAGSEQKLADGMDTFSEKLGSAVSGADTLASGAADLNNGFDDYSKGFGSLQSGATQLASGTNELSDGAAQLDDGMSKLSDGSDELATSLKDAAEKTSNIQSSDALTTMFADPVKLTEKQLSDVPNYGVGIAPYFLSLALFVGGLMAANILPLGRREDMQVSGTVQFFSKLTLVYVVAIVQAVILDLIFLFGFQVDVKSIPLFFLSSIVVSMTVMTIILTLVTLFGNLGKLLSIVLLVVQLATCGGTFPSELSVSALASVGKYLPMAHSLHSLQEAITLGDWSVLGNQLVDLLIYLVVVGVIGWIVSHLQHRPKKENELEAA
ncbi:YhgE/Pip domain-containing protein [Terribacillus saccharophilus]|uniref:YhgE/Pip domain-containing protein n=1 Tax=Terribacillus saccharophilus TaxID=361277 RepID=UPI000BA542F3|nr:YhgE/Pip domain-containing protein [Terribacillus saccharophilus]PAF19011.1 phage infection protein [Terribacillus saccharophilus]